MSQRIEALRLMATRLTNEEAAAFFSEIIEALATDFAASCGSTPEYIIDSTIIDIVPKYFFNGGKLR